MPKTILALGAHYDDCVYGIPGIMLQAVARHHRVVILSLIGDYSTWPPIGQRYRELLSGTVQICREYGVEMRYLDYKSHHFEANTESKQAVAQVVAEVKPDVAFLLWPHDHHEDHVVASQICRAALRGASSLLDHPAGRPREIYYYDNGPGHTIGFEPNTYVDISDQWEAACGWLGRFMALVRGEAYDPTSPSPAEQGKQILSQYRGRACGVRYAEAVQAIHRTPRDIL